MTQLPQILKLETSQQRPWNQAHKDKNQSGISSSDQCKKKWHLQTKTMRYYDIPIRMAKIQNTNSTKSWQAYGAMGILIHCRWEYSHTRIVWQLLTKLNIHLSENAAIILLTIYPVELKTYIHTKTCTWMFRAALLVTAKTWSNKFNRRTANKLRYIHPLGEYSAIKENKLSSHKKTWKDLKGILLSKRSQSEKANMIPTMRHLEEAKQCRQ